MKITSPMLILLAGVLLSGATVGISGSWNAAPRPDSSPKKIDYEPVFEFKVDGDKLTGTAHTPSGWPGNGTISDGKVEGYRIAFTLTYDETYRTNGKMFYAIYRCTGTVHGDELDLAMIPANEGLGSWALKGKRVE